MELRRGADLVKGQEKPLRLLIRLVASAGQVVGREDLYRELWAADTFVEFDVGLATAVKKVRQMLGDSAANPRFVETVPKQGYRFIAPVQIVFPSAKTETAPLAVAEIVPDVQPAPAAATGLRYRWWVAAAAGVTIVALLLIWLGTVGRPEAPMTPRITPLTSHPGTEAHPSFSPDGTQVVFAWNGEEQRHTDLYVATVGGGGVQQLTTDEEVDDYPVWSPDGRYIAYIRALRDLMLVSARGGAPRKLANASGYHLAWSPDGSRILFGMRSPDSEISDLYSVSVASGEVSRLSIPVSQVYTFAPFGYSPGGRWFAYLKRPDPRSAFQIYVVPSGGGEPRPLTSLKRSVLGWSWISEREFLLATPGSGREVLWRIFGDRGREQPLTPTLLGDGTYPAFVHRAGAAGGASTNLLAFERRQTTINLYSFAPPRGDRLHLAPSTRIDGSPQISPDGKRMVFISDRSGSEEVWLSTSDGANPVALTSFGTGDRQPGSPKWAPDGHAIVFDLQELGHHRIYTLGLDGGAPRRTVNWDCETIRPNWSRDGKWIYFGANPAGQFEIWKVPAETGNVPSTEVSLAQAQRVTEGGGWEGAESIDGGRLFYMRSRTGNELWETTLSGGRAAPLIRSGVFSGWWSVAADGIYYADIHLDREQAPPTHGDRPIRYYRFATGRSEAVGAIPGRIKPPTWIFALRPTDGGLSTANTIWTTPTS